MTPKILFFLLVSYSSSYADFTSFEDLFTKFDATSWRKDHGTRHCGTAQILGGCVLNQEENLHYVQHDFIKSQPWKSDELQVSIRNNCKGDHCCDSEGECTAYTSGQITSNRLYRYGSFSFMMKIHRKIKTYEIKSTSFKSVHCAYSPSNDRFPAVLRRPSTAGYCEKDVNADLQTFSSNQDLCYSAVVKASSKNICARYTWVIEIFTPSTFHFKASGKSIDYENTAIYVGDELTTGGSRNLIQDFEIKVEAIGIHKVEIYGFEDCCAGNHRQGYNGWIIQRQENDEDPSESDTDPPYKRTRRSGSLTGFPVANTPSTAGGDTGPAGSGARSPPSTNSAGSSVEVPSTSHAPKNASTSSVHGNHLSVSFHSGCDEAGPSGIECSDFSSDGDEEHSELTNEEDALMAFMELVGVIQEQTCSALATCEEETPREEIIKDLQDLNDSVSLIDEDVQSVLEQQLLQDNPTAETLLVTIREIQTMVQTALDRCQRTRNETLPKEIVHDLVSVYDSLVRIEGILVYPLLIIS